MQKLDLVEILKDCSKGTKLYSPICGECELTYVDFRNSRSCAIVVKALCKNPIIHALSFGRDGTYMGGFDDRGNYYGLGECMLFPSKENRD